MLRFFYRERVIMDKLLNRLLVKGYDRIGYICRENGNRLLLCFEVQKRMATDKIDMYEEDEYLGEAWCRSAEDFFKTGKIGSFTNLQDDISFICDEHAYLTTSLKEEQFGGSLSAGVGEKIFWYRGEDCEYKGLIAHDNFLINLHRNGVYSVSLAIDEEEPEVSGVETRRTVKILGISSDNLLVVVLCEVGDSYEIKMVKGYNQEGKLVRKKLVNDEGKINIKDRNNRAKELEREIIWVV
jgi:hypothetical protein